MNSRTLLRLTVACVTCVALAPSTRSATTDSVALAWKLPADARYRVVSTLEQETSTQVADQVQHESMSQRTTRLVVVDDVDEQGTMDLTVTIDALSMRKVSETMTMTLSAGPDDKGKLQVKATVETTVPAFDTEEFEDFFEAVVTNLVEVGFALRVTPRGQVLSSKASGNPFDNIPATTEAAALATEVLKMMLSPEDLAQAVAAELFVQLPDQRVEAGDHWPVARELSVSGIRMVGTGKSTLQRIDSAGGSSLAMINEQLEYAVITDDFETRLAGLMSKIYEQLGVQVAITVDLRADPISAESNATFDMDGGYCRSVKWNDLNMPMSGTMSVGKQGVDMNMLVEMSNGSSTWTPLEVK